MGAGRKTETFLGNSGAASSKNASSTDAQYSLNMSISHRNLRKSNLGGVIFGCTNITMKECLSKQLFGLPSGHFAYAKNIEAGLPLFLFNYSDRKLHGIFEAASHGQLNINPYAWSDGTRRTQYPSQVQIRVRLYCQALHEDQFKPIISDNYYIANHFWFELDHSQTSKLISLLASLAIASSFSAPLETARWTNIPAVISPGELRGGVQERSLTAADDEHSNRSSGISLLADDFPPLGRETLSFCSGSEVNGEVLDENQLLIMKLKNVVLNQELQEWRSEDDARDISPMEEAASTVKNSVEAPRSLEENNEKKLESSSLSYPAIIDKLIRELAELKVDQAKKTHRLRDLEGKLARAETEIQRLKNCCSNLESTNDPFDQSTWEPAEEPSKERHLDPRESIFLLGGFNGVSWLSTMDSYFPSLNVIKSLEPMSSSHTYTSVVNLNEELYVFGGGDAAESWYNTVNCYSIAENTWTSKPPLNAARGSAGGAVLHEKIFAIGGGNGRECFSEVEILDLDLGRWIPSRSMLQRRFSVAAAELNGAIYASGGYDGENYLNSAERFDPREYSWTRMPNMKSRRGCHSLVVLNEKLYAVGGFDGTTKRMTSSVEVFDPRLGSWIIGEPMSCGRGYAAVAVLDGSIYVIGGMREDEIIADTVERYMEGEGWRGTVATVIGKRCFSSAIAL